MFCTPSSVRGPRQSLAVLMRPLTIPLAWVGFMCVCGQNGLGPTIVQKLPFEALRSAPALRTGRFVESAFRTSLRRWSTLLDVHGLGGGYVGRWLQWNDLGSLPMTAHLCWHEGPISFPHCGGETPQGCAYERAHSPR